MRTLIEPVAVTILCFIYLVPAHAAAMSGKQIYAQGVADKLAPCASCHGARAEGLAPFPRLAGLPAAYVVGQMQAYADGRRPNAVMQEIARLMDADQTSMVADYVASAAAPFLPAGKSSADVLAAGARLVAIGKWSAGVPACRDCHGPRIARRRARTAGSRRTARDLSARPAQGVSQRHAARRAARPDGANRGEARFPRAQCGRCLCRGAARRPGGRGAARREEHLAAARPESRPIRAAAGVRAAGQCRGRQSGAARREDLRQHSKVRGPVHRQHT